MKKNYFMLAAATMMFAACAETDLVNEVNMEEAPKAIGFETFAQKATRAVENNKDAAYSTNNDLSDHHTSFLVWGYKNTDDDNKVIDGVTVTWKSDANPKAWDYVTTDVSPIYWDKAATSYDFYAVAPAKTGFWTLNDNTADQGDDYVTIENFQITTHNANSSGYSAAISSFANVTNAEDLMIAEKNHYTKTSGTVPSQAVALNFTHILSRLNVTVKASISGVKVQKIVIGNINSQGSFNEVPTTTEDDVTTEILEEEDLAKGTNLRWTLVEAKTETVDDETTTIPAPTVQYTFNGASTALSTTSLGYAIQSLVIPQIAILEDVSVDATDFSNLVEPYLYIEYTINDEPYTQAHNLAAAFGAKADDNDDTNGVEFQTIAFNEGWQNTLNLTIGGDKITFVGNVASWTDNKTGAVDIK